MSSIGGFLIFLLSFWGDVWSYSDELPSIDYAVFVCKPADKSKEVDNNPEHILKRNVFHQVNNQIIIDRKNPQPLYVAVKLSKKYPKGQYYLVVEDCFIDRMDFYQKKKRREWEVQTIGSIFPFSNRPVNFHFPSFAFQKNTEKDQAVLLIVHNYIHNTVLPIKIYTEDKFQRYIIQSYFTWGVYLGFLLLILLISAGMYFLSKDSIFTYVFITIFSGICWVLFNSGIGFQFLWPNHPEFMESGRFICYQISYLFLLISFEKFLKIEIKNTYHLYFNVGLKTILLLSILLSFNPFHLTNDHSWMSLFFLLSNSALLICSLYVLFHLFTEIKNHNLNAWFYFLSIILIFLGSIGLTLMKYEMIEPKFIFLYLNYLGILIQVSALVLGLMMEYFIQKREKMKLEISLIMAQAEERQRIAIDMHDELGSSISTIKLISELGVKKKSKLDNEQILSMIYQKSLFLNLKLKEIIWTLQHTNDYIENLINYLHSYGNSYFSPLGIEFKMEIPSELLMISINGNKRRHILLICKEIFSNVAQHSQCSKVELKVNLSEFELILKIIDNGVGFSTPIIKGNGLKIIEQRINSIQGKMEIIQENGVSFNLIIPL